MRRNPVRRRIDTGEVALGLIVRLTRSGEIARIAQATGHDFLFIDTQHAAFSRESVAEIITAAQGRGVAPLVRVRGYDDPDASLFLDAGAAGIIVPDVASVEQAASIVRACRFPPLGNRSLPGPLTHFDLQEAPAQEAMDRANAETVIVCMIETTQGLASVDDIAGIEGVDVLHVGCVDLLLALGEPGAFGCPAMREAIDRVAHATREHHKILGIGGDRDPERRADYVRQGARFMTTGTDVEMLTAEATRIVTSIRNGTPA